MLELAEEKYIIEAEPGELEKQKKRHLLSGRMKGMIAAALLLLVFGITYLVTKQLNLTDGGEEQTETKNILDEDEKQTDINENQDYASIFTTIEENEPGLISSDYTLEEPGGTAYRFDTPEAFSDLPFDMEGFQQRQAYVYCDKDGVPVNLLLTLSASEGDKSMSLVISGRGGIYSCYPTDILTEEKNSVIRNGVQVYGFDNSANSDTISLSLYFKMNQQGYSMECSGMTYEEAGKILDGILTEGMTVNSLDISQGIQLGRETRSITLAEAEKLEAFKGYVTNLTSINDMTLIDNRCDYYMEYENHVLVQESLCLQYNNGAYDYIELVYETDMRKDESNIVKVSELTPDIVGSYAYNSDIEGNHWYSFIIDCNDKYIYIGANCTEEEIWKLLESIRKM